MATTIVHIACRPGTTAVYATSAGGTGAPAAIYVPTQLAGYLHSISVPEALVGDWYFGGGNAAGDRGYRMVYGLTDTATTFDLTSDVAAAVTDELNPIMGSLPFTVGVVDDSDGTDIEGATVRVSRTGKSAVEDTGAGGEAVFSVDAFTWTITVDAPGYATKSTTYTVSGAGESTEVRLSSISLPASTTSGVCSCSVFVVDQNGNDVDGAEVSTSLKNAKSAKFSGNSLVHVTGDEAITSGGTATIDLIQGMTYVVMVKHGKTQIKFEFTVPAATSAVMKKVTV